MNLLFKCLSVLFHAKMLRLIGINFCMKTNKTSTCDISFVRLTSGVI